MGDAFLLLKAVFYSAVTLYCDFTNYHSWVRWFTVTLGYIAVYLPTKSMFESIDLIRNWEIEPETLYDVQISSEDTRWTYVKIYVCDMLLACPLKVGKRNVKS